MEYVYQMNPSIFIAGPGTKLSPKIVSWVSKWKNAHCTYFCDFNIVTNAQISYKKSANMSSVEFSSVHFSHSVVSDSLWPHESQHTRPPCPSPTPGGHSDSRPSSQWCHPTISSFVVPFSSCLQSFPASGSSPVSQFFPSGGQSIGVSSSVSVLPMNIQDWFPLGWTGLISL